MKVFTLAEPAQIEITDLVSSVLGYGADECEKRLYVLILKGKGGKAVYEVNGFRVAGTSVISFRAPKVDDRILTWYDKNRACLELPLPTGSVVSRKKSCMHSLVHDRNQYSANLSLSRRRPCSELHASRSLHVILLVASSMGFVSGQMCTA